MYYCQSIDIILRRLKRMVASSSLALFFFAEQLRKALNFSFFFPSSSVSFSSILTVTEWGRHSSNNNITIPLFKLPSSLMKNNARRQKREIKMKSLALLHSSANVISCICKHMTKRRRAIADESENLCQLENCFSSCERFHWKTAWAQWWRWRLREIGRATKSSKVDWPFESENF